MLAAGDRLNSNHDHLYVKTKRNALHHHSQTEAYHIESCHFKIEPYTIYTIPIKSSFIGEMHNSNEGSKGHVAG